ncbi:helix-turn-helix domain-containing protein [Paenibacillus sp. strain BS8-2]
MDFTAIWTYEPKLSRYHYFLDKPAFELAVDLLPHWAAFAIEKGSCVYRIGEEEGTAGEWEVLVCPPYTSFHRQTSGPITFHFFVFDWVDGSGARLEPSSYPLEAKWKFQDGSRLFSSLQWLRSHGWHQEETPLHRQNHLWNDIIRLYVMEQEELDRTAVMQQDDPLMQEVHAHIEAAYDQPLQIQELAYRFGLSPVQLSRRYQRAYGSNPSEQLLRLRLWKACYLLTHTRFSLDAIAQRCGFANGFYLSRVFTKQRGMSPSAYRLANRV